MSSSSTEIEDQDVAFANNFLVETIGNNSGCEIVDDLENVHSQDNASILCSLSL